MDRQLKFVHHTVKMLRRLKRNTTLFWFYLTIILITVNGQRQHSVGGPVQGPSFEELKVRDDKSNEIQKYMNLSVDPCDDFYEFACGQFNEFHKTEDGEMITQFSLLEMRIIKNLQELLQKPPPGQDATSIRKIKHFYESCIQENAQSQNQHKYYMDFITKHGGLPHLSRTNWDKHYNWELVVGELFANYGMEILIGLRIEPSMENTRGGGNKVFLDEPIQKLVSEEYCSAAALMDPDTKEKFFDNKEEEVAKNLGNWFELRQSDRQRIAGDIVSFQYDLCKLIGKDQVIEDEEREENELSAKSYGKRPAPNRVGQSRLHNNNRRNSQYLHLNSQELNKRFEINFVRYFNTIFPPRFNDQAFLRSEAYFAGLAQLLKVKAKHTLAYYIMYAAVSALSFPEDDSPQNRTRFCTDLTMRYFPHHLGEIYFRRHYNEDIKKDIENIYQKIEDAFSQSFNVENVYRRRDEEELTETDDVKWMSDNFKSAAKQKLARFKVRIPPYENLDLQALQLDNIPYRQKLERIMKYKVTQELDKLNNFANRLSERVVEAYDIDVGLETRDNELQIGLGLHQSNFYHHAFYGNSLKYSLIGQALAKALVFAFDEQGWNKDSQSPMHWDDYTTQGFHKQAQCFRTQFSHYLYNNPDDFRDAVKLRNLIAHSSGLNIAFRAYLLWLNMLDTSRNQNSKKETLTNVNFTNTQLFFINFAQMRCATTNNSEQKMMIPTDWHTEERFSVNGPLSNFDEFAREFNCAPGTQMNPGDKCVIF